MLLMIFHLILLTKIKNISRCIWKVLCCILCWLKSYGTFLHFKITSNSNDCWIKPLTIQTRLYIWCTSQIMTISTISIPDVKFLSKLPWAEVEFSATWYLYLLNWLQFLCILIVGFLLIVIQEEIFALPPIRPCRANSEWKLKYLHLHTLAYIGIETGQSTEYTIAQADYAVMVHLLGQSFWNGVLAVPTISTHITSYLINPTLSLLSCMYFEMLK